MEDYVLEKAKSVATTGYPTERYRANFKIDGTVSDLAEGFLGLRRLPVNAVEVFERRFEIDLPVSSDEFGSDGAIEITPKPTEVGTLILTDAHSGDHLDIPCEVVVPPSQLLQWSDVRVLFRWPMGSFLMAANEWKFTPSARTNATSENTISEWLLHVRTMDMLERRRINIKYIGVKGELSFTGNDQEARAGSPQYRSIERKLSEIDRLLMEAGNPSDATSLGGLWNQRRLVETITSFQNRAVRFTFRTGPMPFPELTNERGLHLGAAQIGTTWVAIAMPMLVSTKIINDEVKWTGYRSGPPVLEALSDGGENTFEKFRKRAKMLSGVPLVFFQLPGAYLGETTAVDTDHIEERYRDRLISA